MSGQGANLHLPPDAVAAGFSLTRCGKVGSTNALALGALGAGENRRWFVADAQEAGRGRHGREWVSLPGNLYASLALAGPCAPVDAPKLGFVAGAALAGAVHDIAPALARHVRLKWPNDLLLDGAKCAGLLLEGTMLNNGAQGVAIGIGVNLAHAPEGLERRVDALNRLAPELTREALFAALAGKMARMLEIFAAGAGFGQIRELWLAHALPMGETLLVKPHGDEIEGRFAGIDGEGHLLILVGGETKTILAGDVFLASGLQSANRAAENIHTAMSAAESK